MAKKIHLFITTHAKRRRERILEALTGQRLTADDLRELLPMDHSTACRYLVSLMSEKPRLIRICDWQAGGERGSRAPVYTLGTGRNTPPPRAMTQLEYYERRMADPAKHAQKIKQCNLGYYKRHGKAPPPATPFAALGV